MKKIIFILVTLIWFSPSSYAGTSIQTEKKIQQTIYSETENSLNLLEQLVNINSGTTNVTGVYKVGELLRPEFEKMGFKTYWRYEPAAFKRAGTLFAERKGRSGKRILLIGHLDTVFPKGSPFQKWERHKNIAIGPGAVDDKGGDIVILYALKALYKTHALEDVSITVALMGDEEDSGKPTWISRGPLKEAAHHADVALDFECSLDLDNATIARRGISSFRIETTGEATHSAGIFKPSVGAGAIFELARILNEMRSQLSTEKYLSFNPGIILGGSAITYSEEEVAGETLGKQNIIARIALVDSDLRFISAEQRQKAEHAIKEIVSKHLPNTNAIVQFKDGIPAMPPTAANVQLLKLYSQGSQDLNLGSVAALSPGDRGAGDISHVAAIVPAGLAGLGPLSAGGGAHSDQEGIDLHSLPIQTTRAAILIYRLTR